MMDAVVVGYNLMQNPESFSNMVISTIGIMPWAPDHSFYRILLMAVR